MMTVSKDFLMSKNTTELSLPLSILISGVVAGGGGGGGGGRGAVASPLTIF